MTLFHVHSSIFGIGENIHFRSASAHELKAKGRLQVSIINCNQRLDHGALQSNGVRPYAIASKCNKKLGCCIPKEYLYPH